MLLLLHKTLKGSRNIQGITLIRAVLLFVNLNFFSLAQISPLELDQNTFNTLNVHVVRAIFCRKSQRNVFWNHFSKAYVTHLRT